MHSIMYPQGIHRISSPLSGRTKCKCIVQSWDSENVQRNLKIAEILRLCGTYTGPFLEMLWGGIGFVETENVKNIQLAT